MHAVIVSTYEMGRQPFGLASPTAWLSAAGWDVVCVDLSREPLRDDLLRSAQLVGFHLPMHTATRLAAAPIARVRAVSPEARLCAFGLYAPLNARWLQSIGIDDVLGGEFEEELSAIAQSLAAHRTIARRTVDHRSTTPRLHFLVPDRRGLPTLDRYATLQLPDGRRQVTGYTEASRGCKHLCRHCPIVPVYNGQFRVVQPDVVLADIDQQVSAGAGHITFGDPDFFNGPTHAMRIVERLHRRHPTLTYDVTIKVEHLLRHRDLLPTLRETGCLFVTSAVESIDDEVLQRLAKGHSRQDFVAAVEICRRASLTLVPTFVAFHPWLTLEGYCDLLDTIEGLDLVGHVAPIQLAIRLLVPEGSRLLELDDVRRFVGRFDPKTLTYRWTHPDEGVEALHQAVGRIVGVRLTSDRQAVFDEVSALAHERAGQRRPVSMPARHRATIPYLNEPWYC